jgi:hypothetical protein
VKQPDLLVKDISVLLMLVHLCLMQESGDTMGLNELSEIAIVFIETTATTVMHIILLKFIIIPLGYFE